MAACYPEAGAAGRWRRTLRVARSRQRKYPPVVTANADHALTKLRIAVILAARHLARW
jgi:hypothetical protein